MVATLKEIEQLHEKSAELNRKVAARWTKFGVMVRDARKEAGWTLEDLAAKSGIEKSLMSYMENGHRTVTMDTALKIVEALCEA